MNAIVLAAGFGTRCYPYTRELPKALLDVGGRPVIDHILAFLDAEAGIEQIHVRTNALHYPLFRDWLRECDYRGKVELSSNGAHVPGESLGAIGDLSDVCSKKLLKEEVLVIAADNIFDFPVRAFLEFCAERDGDIAAVMECNRRSELCRGGVVEVTSDGRIIHFEEKPLSPRSNLLALPLYRLSSETIPFLARYVMDGNDTDRIGSFFAWSYRRRPLYAYRVEGTRYHLADAASYRRICTIFEKNLRS